MRKLLLLGMVVVAMLITACSQSTQPAQQGVTCNKPYILVGQNCCLDQNDNRICDSDESVAEAEPPKTSSDNEDTKEKSMVDCGYAQDESSSAFNCLLNNLETCNEAVLTSWSQDTYIINGKSGNYCSFTWKEYSDTFSCNFPLSRIYPGIDLDGLSSLVGEFCANGANEE